MNATALLTLLFISAPVAAAAQTRLQLPDAAKFPGRAYTIELVQALDLESEGQVHKVSREARLRFHTASAQASGASVSGTVIIDSLRAALESPHGREIIDARTAMGDTIRLSYTRNGGPPAYEGTAAIIDYSMIGEPMPITSLLDFAFPALADKVVRAGETWDRTYNRKLVDGRTLIDRKVTARYTLRSIQPVAGANVARVEVSGRADAVGEIGALEVSGYFLIGVDDGVVREVSIDETHSGAGTFGPARMPYRQRTTVRVALVSQAHR